MGAAIEAKIGEVEGRIFADGEGEGAVGFLLKVIDPVVGDQIGVAQVGGADMEGIVGEISLGICLDLAEKLGLLGRLLGKLSGGHGGRKVHMNHLVFIKVVVLHGVLGELEDDGLRTEEVDVIRSVEHILVIMNPDALSRVGDEKLIPAVEIGALKDEDLGKDLRPLGLITEEMEVGKVGIDLYFLAVGLREIFKGLLEIEVGNGLVDGKVHVRKGGFHMGFLLKEVHGEGVHGGKIRMHRPEQPVHAVIGPKVVPMTRVEFHVEDGFPRLRFFGQERPVIHHRNSSVSEFI